MYKILLQSQKLKVVCFLFFALLSQIIIAQEREISGVVMDNSGLPLPGASVLLKGTSNGVVTNFDGEFEISIQEGKDQILLVSYIGYLEKEIELTTESYYEISL